MANKVYVARETAIDWSDTAGDLVMTLNNLAAAAVRVGARKDWGAGSTSEWYEWRLTVQFETAPVVGETVLIYLSWSDGSEEDGQLGAAYVFHVSPSDRQEAGGRTGGRDLDVSLRSDYRRR